jgi:peptidoglycan/LPS O-acetylase OafA/YrhL
VPLRRDIQGLRALAVLAVIGAHAAGWPRAASPVSTSSS